MMKSRLIFVGAFLLACFGGAVAWYKAMASTEVRLAREYVLHEEKIIQKYQGVTDPILTGFRLSLSNGGASYCTFWVKTPVGRKFISVMIDKSTETWTLRELNSD